MLPLLRSSAIFVLAYALGGKTSLRLVPVPERGSATSNIAAADAVPANPRSLMLEFSGATLARWPNGRFVAAGTPWKWNYELGVLLEGMDLVWEETGDPNVYRYIRGSIDSFVSPTGSIATYRPSENQLDSILLGRQLMLLYRRTHAPRYAKAAALLYQQLMRQPRTRSGGFWHKQIYPDQMWLDGLYMAEPFYAEYASIFHHPEAFSDVTHQFVLIQQHAYDPATGLLFHGWDESRKQRWANPTTGTSAQIWARGMGWYLMALVDTLPYYPANAPGRKVLLEILRREASAVIHYQSADSGLWFEVMDKAGDPGNYPESSASCMFVYALAKGVRLGYLPQSDLRASERGFQGIVSHFVHPGANHSIDLTGTVKGAGLGGDPYRDGSYRYYLSEKVVTNDPKGIGAFLLASGELAKMTGPAASAH